MDKSLCGRRVLVVEDEMLVCMMIEDMLADLGCESVTTAATVDQALAAIDAHTFDAAMLDMNLNGNKSYPVADALKVRGVPFFFATGYGGYDMSEVYRDRSVVMKPFGEEDLNRVFTRLLAR